MAFENIYSNPLIWGPPTWYIIHILAYTYNEENREQYKRFFDVFKEVIPCPHCKKDYNEYINLKPPDFTFYHQKLLEFQSWSLHQIIFLLAPFL